MPKAELREEAVRDALRGPASPMPASTRQAMEARFSASFADVRIRSDRAAADAARSAGARALTVGRDILFAEGEYRRGGDRLLAHELAHVRQQREAAGTRIDPVPAFDLSAGPRADEVLADLAAERVVTGRAAPPIPALGGGLRLQAQKAADKGKEAATAAAQTPAGPTLNIVIKAPDDAYTQDVTDYMKNTLGEQVVVVDNLEEAVRTANAMAKANQVQFGKVRLIGHGSTTGGIAMTPTGQTGRRFVTAEELEAMSADQKLKASADEAMADGSVVEFWGCYVGGSEKSMAAVGQIFQSDAKATDATLRTAHDSFTRPADHGEKGEKLPKQQGTWMTVVSTDEIDFRVKEGNKQLGESFNRWLLAQAAKLEAAGELPPQADEAARIATMRTLFNRSGGKIKRAVISSGGENIGRGDKKKWADKWKTKKIK